MPHWRRHLTWGSVGDGQRVVVCAPPAMPQPKGHLHLNAQERGLEGGPRVQRHDVGLEEGPHEQGREAHTNDPNRNAYLITRWGKTSHLGTYLTPAVWFGRCWEWQIEKRFMFTTGHRRSTNASSVCTRRRKPDSVAVAEREEPATDTPQRKQTQRRAAERSVCRKSQQCRKDH